MRNCTKNTAIGEATALCAIATQQLPLFVGLPTFEEELPPYPLQIKAIPPQNRIKPDNYCKLVHLESGLNIGGQFTYDEAVSILETTRYWDFSLDKHRIPRCVERLRALKRWMGSSRLKDGGEANA